MYRAINHAVLQAQIYQLDQPFHQLFNTMANFIFSQHPDFHNVIQYLKAQSLLS